LVFTPQQHGAATCYHIEAPSKSRFYRVGYPEYVFLSLLDGQTTVAQAVTLSTRALGAGALSQPQALEVAQWLLQQGLAHVADDSAALWRTDKNSSKSLLHSLNPFWMKVPLGHPDGLLNRLLPLTGWLFSPLATMVGALVILLGIATVATQWNQFIDSAHLIFSPYNWLLMGLVWIGLKIVHELAHGLVCKRYGGEVRETGIIFILFAPAAFVDVTSSWRFTSKWQRIHVAAAGMYVELALAAVAAMAWTQVDSQLQRHLLYNTILMASISTLLFNANPLMRFDGYYILSDLLGVPNLATEGAQFIRRLAARLFLGRAVSSAELTGSHGWVIRIYGLAAWFWRFFVCASLLAAASVLLKGAGIALGVLGIVCWFGLPAVHIAQELYRQLYESPIRVLRAAAVAGVVTGTLLAILVWCPWPAAVCAPIVVEYTDSSIVRCKADGFIDALHVRDGSRVAAGDLLLELRNDELQTEFLELQASVRQAEAKQREALRDHDAGQIQITSRNLQALHERFDEIRQQRAGLRIFAPVAGRVVARNLEIAIGKYVEEGTELMTVADEGRKELLVSVSHDRIDNVAPLLGQSVKFRTHSLSLYEGKLTRLEPRASRQLPHPAFSATVGGSLPVRQSAEEDQAEIQLVDPRFPGVIDVPSSVSSQLACGQRGYARFGISQESIGQHLWIQVCRWLQQLSKLRQGSS
jgi:putative peptide zinc metalloprotease protein